MTNNPPLTDADLDAIQRGVDAASKAPWEAFIAGPGDSLDSVIRVGTFHDDEPDIYVFRDREPANDAGLDFIAAARQDVPRLIAEIKRLRHELDHTT